MKTPTKLWAMVFVLSLVWGCGPDASALNLNETWLGRYEVTNITTNLNACELPEFLNEDIDLTQDWIVLLSNQSTDIGSYMGSRLCLAEDVCTDMEPVLLYSELRDGRWLAEKRTAVAYNSRCVYQHVRSFLTISDNQLNFTLSTVRRAGEFERPEGTQCNTTMVEDLLDQDLLTCINSEELNMRKVEDEP